MHRDSILYQEIHEVGFPEGRYHAHIPSLNLTTHGEEIPLESTVFFSQIDIPDAALSI